MDRVAYYISAPENSGNRMLRKCFCSSGCYGDPEKEEWFGCGPEDIRFKRLPHRIVFSRSVPNGSVVVYPYLIAVRMKAAGYRIVPITIHRKTDFAVAGQARGYPGRTPEQALAYIQICAEMMHEFAAWLNTPLVTVIYESFVLWPSMRAAFFAQFGLPPPDYALFNANERYDMEGPVLPY